MDNKFTHVKDWKSTSEFVDVDTGEIITKRNAIKDYIIIKKSKTVKINKENGTGTIKWTNECQRDRQTKLWQKNNRN